jgi:hypothetical protein
LEEEEKLKNFDPNNVQNADDVIEPFAGKVISTTSTSGQNRRFPPVDRKHFVILSSGQ